MPSWGRSPTPWATAAGSLQPLTVYTVTISTTATDLAGNAFGSAATLTFTTGPASTTNWPLVLQSADSVTGPYGDVSGQVVNIETKSITVPVSGAMQFYRLQSNSALKITGIRILEGAALLIYK